jgi:2-phospho-L-lactate guanylyltransferase
VALRKTRVVVLVKDFDTAKQRLSSVLDAESRRALAADLAFGVLRAAGPDALVVAGSEGLADELRRLGNEVVVDRNGQNGAARAGIEQAVALGARAVLLLSSDLPLIQPETVGRMLAEAEAMTPPAVLAAPAIGRGGTNALYLAPPDAIGLHFGDDSLAKFAADARERGVRFALHESPELALDIDEPADLAALQERQAG